MGTYTGDAIAQMIAEQLTDSGNVIWPEMDIIYPAITEAQNFIVFLRPEASSSVVPFTCAAGSCKQEIPATGLAFLDVTRNLGLNGTTPGKPIKKIPKAVLDDSVPGWTIEETTDRIQQYVFEPENPRFFWVYPTPSVALQVELSQSLVPAPVASGTDTISLPDTYITPILEWVKAVCLLMPSAGTNTNLGLQHQAAFYTMLGVKRQTDETTEQKRRG
ncbi:MAG: hypothetical protein JEZ12_15985 [Desulfobacterium sp.]|nr:hypothetical protein [Desulfobacterium sp.]